MDLSNLPQLQLILLFLSIQSLPLEAGCDITQVVDAHGCAVRQRDVRLLKRHIILVQPDGDIHGSSMNARVGVFTWNKAKGSLCSARWLTEARGTEQTTGDRRKCHSF